VPVGSAAADTLQQVQVGAAVAAAGGADVVDTVVAGALASAA